jgi:uncharacterized protein VirK/YbjX
MFNRDRPMMNAQDHVHRISADAPTLQEKIAFLFNSLLHPSQTYRWMQFLKNYHLLEELPVTAIRLISKIHQPYFSANLTCAQRVDALIEHYEVASRMRVNSLIKKGAAKGITICEFDGKSGTSYRLELSTTDVKNPEGEISFRLLTSNICVYTATFNFVEVEGIPYIKISGLRGFLATDHTLRIKSITKDLYGCRPRDLMVSIVREVGECFGCFKTLLISNARKLSIPGMRVCKKSSDYDQIWLEMNACRRSDGDFELPCTHVLNTAGNSFDASVLSENLPNKRRILVDSILLAVRRRITEERSSAARFVFSSPEATVELKHEMLQQFDA